MSSHFFRLLLAGAAAFANIGTAAAAPISSTEFDVPPVVGMVVDAAGRPLANVRVMAEGTSRTATTSADGTFVLRALSAGEHHLSASLVGYVPAHVEVDVPTTGTEVRVRIVLTPTPLTLEGVIVTGTPVAANPLTVTQSTLQMSGRELDRNLGSTVAQTLANEPGIATRYSGPAASTPVIRGLTGERVLVLENGQRTGDLSGTSPDHALSLDPLSASRIEVVRGPASLLYGSSALGGVVNVIETDIPTEVPGRINGFAAAQAESVNPGGAATAQVSLPLGSDFALLVRGGRRDVDDVRIGGGGRLDNTYLQNLKGDLGVGYVGRRLTGGVALGGYGFDYGLPAAPDAEEAGVHIEGRRYSAKGRAELALERAGFGTVHLNGSAQWYTHDEVEPEGEVGTTFRLNTQTLDLRATTDVLGINGTVGTSGFLRQYEPTGEEALTPPANSNSGGIFVYQEIPLRGFGHEGDDHTPRLQLGARYDLYRINTRAGDETFGSARSLNFGAFSGSAGVNVPFSHETSLGLSVARAFRAPTVEELFSNGFHAATGSFERGNPDLGEETNLGIEGVLRSQTGALQTMASVYYNRISDYITPVPMGEIEVETEDGLQRVPLTEYMQATATLRGVEGQLEAVVARHVVLGLMGDIVRGRFSDGGAIPFMPAARMGTSARYDNGRLSLGTEVRHTFAQDRAAENEFAAGAYTLVDASLAYTLPFAGRAHTFTLRADNLLDVQYREAASRIKEFAPNPGRNLSLVYRVYF